MKKMRVAVVSTDGIHVNEHFGEAERFLIYDIGDPTNFVEERATVPLSGGGLDHAFDADKFNRIAALLKDCSKVYVTQIGDKPASELASVKIEPVIYSGAISRIT